MADRLVIENTKLARQIRRIAKQERRSVEEVLSSMITQYQPQSAADEVSDSEALARSVRQAAYQEARTYWNRVGNAERANLTDQQLDEAFWLFDDNGIPRLKTDQVELPPSSLHDAGQVLRSAGFHSGQTDISARSREILNDEFTDYLLSRDDADHGAST